MMFYLGTHRPNWIGRLSIPLCVSRRQLAARTTLPRASAPIVIDSGGFSELTLHGQWTVPPRQYVGEVGRFISEIGHIEWAAIQDWMCEPPMLKRTGLTIAEHQTRTVVSFLELRDHAPEYPWLPVIQGWDYGDYQRHVDQYDRAGVDLTTFDTVGIGSVCRRQGSNDISRLIRTMARKGISLHGFGVKSEGLKKTAHHLRSADSMAWSFVARRRPIRLEGCTTHRNCANCERWACQWRQELLAGLAAQHAAPIEQLSLFDVA